MSAIITDQFRILSAKNFITSIGSTVDNYYAFVGLTNSTDYDTDWESLPPSPIDSFDNYTDIWDTIIALKKINSSDVKHVIKKIAWSSGTRYDMYRHDISRNNLSKPSNSTTLYASNFYVINSDFNVYICLHNGVDPENPSGKTSIDEPTFTDLEPRSAGTSGDGYIWKYLFSMKPNDIIKFDSLDYIPVPSNWDTNSDVAKVRDNASNVNSGQLKIVTITNRGVGLGNPKTYTNVPIVGNGSGGKVTIVVGNNNNVESVTVSSGGSGYTFGSVDLAAAGITGTTLPSFNVIIPPPNGHGSDIYSELGAKNILIYSRIENDNLDPDFIVGNKVARIGIIKNPLVFGTTDTKLTKDKASNAYAIKLDDYTTSSFAANSTITQTVSTGTTAVGRVVSFNNVTGVLKYWQDRYAVGFSTGSSSLSGNVPQYGYTLNAFISSTNQIQGETNNVGIDTIFTGISTQINNTTYNLGQEFTDGLANPEVKRYTGEMIYIDNRPSITRSKNQKEDIKVVLQF